MDIAVECKDLGKTFPNVAAVQGLSFQVDRGEVFGLVGPDGAGKTTTLRMLCGIMPPTSGTIKVLGAEVPGHVDQVVSDIGYMSQRFSLYGDLSVQENIEFFADLHQVPADARKERMADLLHASRMEPFHKRRADQLSGGMKQKLALVCTLIHTPKVLLLDEPTTGVDPISRREFWQILYGLVAEGMTLIVSTPYMDEADRCQRLALIDKGKLLTSDTPANLRKAIKRTVVDIQTPSAKRARAALTGTPHVIAVEAFGERLHATVRSEEDIPRLRETLESKGIQVEDLRPVAPNLEDAFIAYLEGGVKSA